MKWNNVEPDIKAISLDKFVRSWSVIDVARLLCFTKDLPVIYFNNSTRNDINKHLSTQNIELGGLLIGRVISKVDLEDGIIAIEVTNSVQSEAFESTHVSLSMDSSVWQLANEKGSEDTFVVGWYHSHPNLGAFFSGTDRRTQSNFFDQAYSLGLVIDPIRNEERWFLGSECDEIDQNRIFLSAYKAV